MLATQKETIADLFFNNDIVHARRLLREYLSSVFLKKITVAESPQDGNTVDSCTARGFNIHLGVSDVHGLIKRNSERFRGFYHGVGVRLASYSLALTLTADCFYIREILFAQLYRRYVYLIRYDCRFYSGTLQFVYQLDNTVVGLCFYLGMLGVVGTVFSLCVLEIRIVPRRASRAL